MPLGRRQEEPCLISPTVPVSPQTEHILLPKPLRPSSAWATPSQAPNLILKIIFIEKA